MSTGYVDYKIMFNFTKFIQNIHLYCLILCYFKNEVQGNKLGTERGKQALSTVDGFWAPVLSILPLSPCVKLFILVNKYQWSWKSSI